MLLMGLPNNIPKDPNIVVFNLTSFKEGLPSLINLVPHYQEHFNTLDELQFDINYAQYVLSSIPAFNELMFIMMNLYDMRDVYITVSKQNWYYESINESLMKLIQQRYGYNYFEINTVEDYEYAKSADYNDYSFNVQGIFNLDQDKELFIRNRVIEEGINENGESNMGEGRLY